jgi:hypothetical protein
MEKQPNGCIDYPQIRAVAPARDPDESPPPRRQGADIRKTVD